MDNKNSTKHRHGCVTAWLTLMIILNSFVAFIYLVTGGKIIEAFPDGTPRSMLFILAITGIANVIFAILILSWKKIGFWGFLITSIITLFINLSIGVSFGQSLLGLGGIIVLYFVLQINKDNVTAWDYLD